MRKFTVVVPTCRTPDLIELLIRTFDKFAPADVENHFIVVENSPDDSYRDTVLSLSKNVTWIQNPEVPEFGTSNIPSAGSIANGLGVLQGLEAVDDDYVFVAHCDVCVTSSSFFEEMFKGREEGYWMVGTGIDNSRIKALHISGFYIKTQLLHDVDIMPVFQDGDLVLDVGDTLTAYCRQNEIQMRCHENTFNNVARTADLDSPYREFHVDRCLDSGGNVMFMHLGRGVPKTKGKYSKPNRVYLPGWKEFIMRNVL